MNVLLLLSIYLLILMLTVIVISVFIVISPVLCITFSARAGRESKVENLRLNELLLCIFVELSFIWSNRLYLHCRWSDWDFVDTLIGFDTQNPKNNFIFSRESFRFVDLWKNLKRNVTIPCEYNFFFLAFDPSRSQILTK